jgi:hypothetical protein
VASDSSLILDLCEKINAELLQMQIAVKIKILHLNCTDATQMNRCIGRDKEPGE